MAFFVGLFALVSMGQGGNKTAAVMLAGIALAFTVALVQRVLEIRRQMSAD